MKKISVLFTVIIVFMTSVQSQPIKLSTGDTLVNNSGRIITVNPPKTIVRPPQRSISKQEPVLIYIQEATPPTPVINNYYPIEYQERPYQSSYGSTSAAFWFIFLGLATLAIVLIVLNYFINRSKECSHCTYEHKCCNHEPIPPVVNHFHVNGGHSNAIIDKSASWANTEESDHYHQHYFLKKERPVAPVTPVAEEKS